jgi:hypothetical protein
MAVVHAARSSLSSPIEPVSHRLARRELPAAPSSWFGSRQTAGMAVLIDEPRWWFRGRKWCHMISDSAFDELHDFADSMGIPRRAFQGDHYDIPEEHRPAMVAAGAVEVGSRELVRRLRAAGLRLSPAERRAGAD